MDVAGHRVELPHLEARMFGVPDSSPQDVRSRILGRFLVDLPHGLQTLPVEFYSWRWKASRLAKASPTFVA